MTEAREEVRGRAWAAWSLLKNAPLAVWELWRTYFGIEAHFDGWCDG